MAVACFDPSESDSLLSSCYCSETSWDNGDLAFLDDPLPVEVDPPVVPVADDVASASASKHSELEPHVEEVSDLEQVTCLEQVEVTPRVAISAPTALQRQREMSSEAQRFVSSCRESFESPDSCLMALAGSLNADEICLVESLCKRRGPRHRLEHGKGISRTTANDRAGLAWCTLEEMLGSLPVERSLQCGTFEACASPSSLPSLISSSTEPPFLTGDALQLAEGMGLDKQLASGLADMFSRHRPYLQKVVENLAVPLKPPEDTSTR